MRSVNAIYVERKKMQKVYGIGIFKKGFYEWSALAKIGMNLIKL